jgi:hypothetical protein
MDMDTDEYAVITRKVGKEGVSGVIQLTKVNDVDGITIKDYTGSVIAENKKATKSFDVADLTITVNSFDQNASNASFSVSSGCANNMLITKEGLQILLPSNVTWSGNLTTWGMDGTVPGDNSSYVFNITEEDKDENIGAGIMYQVNVSFNTDTEAHAKFANGSRVYQGGQSFSVDDTKVYVGYIRSNVSSKITEDKTADQYDVEIMYPGEETYADFYIGSKASKVTTSASGESVAVSKIEVGAAVLDSSLASYTSQNLIVVGGPAINKASAALLGKKYPAYGAESGIPENAGLIKLVEQADGTVAMIVAGWEAEDTQRACRVVAESDQYAMSGKEVQVTGTSMTDITVGVPATA